MKETFKGEQPIGERIRYIREKRDLTMEVICSRADISQSYLSEIERGKIKSPGIDLIIRIAEALGVSLDELVNEKPNKVDQEEKAPQNEDIVDNQGFNAGFNKMKENTLTLPQYIDKIQRDFSLFINDDSIPIEYKKAAMKQILFDISNFVELSKTEDTDE